MDGLFLLTLYHLLQVYQQGKAISAKPLKFNLKIWLYNPVFFLTVLKTNYSQNEGGGETNKLQLFFHNQIHKLLGQIH